MTACRVFLVGEGPSDIGDLASQASYRDPDDPREGFLQPILRNLVGPDIELDFFDGRKLTVLAGPTRKQPRHWLQRRKAHFALALATSFGADALVFSCDLDKGHGKHSEVERRKRLQEVRTSISEGFDHARESDPDAKQVLTAIAVPARMIEAWALGDRDALTELLGMATGDLSYGNPEELWGDGENPASDHPKCTWHRITDGAVTLAEAAEAAEPTVLRTSCPESFGAFADDVEAAVEQCPRYSVRPRGIKVRRHADRSRT